VLKDLGDKAAWDLRAEESPCTGVESFARPVRPVIEAPLRARDTMRPRRHRQATGSSLGDTFGTPTGLARALFETVTGSGPALPTHCRKRASRRAGQPETIRLARSAFPWHHRSL
jgi:hypothetical protein